MSSNLNETLSPLVEAMNAAFAEIQKDLTATLAAKQAAMLKQLADAIAAAQKAAEEAAKPPVVETPVVEVPVVTPPVVEPVKTRTVAGKINDYTNANWNKGVWITDSRACVTIADTAESKAAFVPGQTVKLSNGEARKITLIQAVDGKNISVWLEGSQLEAAVGAPNNVSVEIALGDKLETIVEAPVVETPATAPVTGGASGTMAGFSEVNFPFLGMNVAGAEFGSVFPGNYGSTYIVPSKNDLAKWKDEGMKFIRFPYKWERIQRSLFGELDGAEMARIDAFIQACEDFDMVVNLDMHNYMKYYIGGKGYEIGTAQVPVAAYEDVYKRLALRYKDRKGVHSFGIMNEPTGTNGRWWPIAQKAITVINQYAPSKGITACGDSYANAHGFEGKNAGLTKIVGKNLWIEVHVYFDGDHKGTYGNRGEQIPVDIGVNRMKDAVAFAQKYGFKLFVGETCAPVDMPSAQAALVKFLDYCKSQNVPVTYWAGGPWWPAAAANGLESGGKIREPISKLRSYRGQTLPKVGPV